MNYPRLSPHADEAARIERVMALVGAEIRREVRRIRRRRAPRDGWRDLRIRLEAEGISPLLIQGWLPHLSDLRVEPHDGAADTARMVRAVAPVSSPPDEAGASLSGAARTPDFSPDFLLNVKHPAGSTPPLSPRRKTFGGRRDCAQICGVSVDWFDRNVARLMREEAYPAPREGEGQRRWNLSLVASWAADPASTEPLKRARAAHLKAMERKAAWAK